MVFINKFCEILIQLPGEPREHHLVEVQQKRCTNFIRQNDREGRYLAHFLEKCKKVKNEVTRTKNIFLGPVTSS